MNLQALSKKSLLCAALFTVFATANAQDDLTRGTREAIASEGSFGDGSVTVHHNLIPEERQQLDNEDARLQSEIDALKSRVAANRSRSDSQYISNRNRSDSQYSSNRQRANAAYNLASQEPDKGTPFIQSYGGSNAQCPSDQVLMKTLTTCRGGTGDSGCRTRKSGVKCLGIR